MATTAHQYALAAAHNLNLQLDNEQMIELRRLFSVCIKHTRKNTIADLASQKAEEEEMMGE